MIAGLKGVLVEKSAMEAIVDVQGVAYRVAVSMMASGRLPEVGAPVSFRVRTIVREDALELFGFLSRTEEQLFEQLTSVSQVGPKMALNVLSGLEVNDLIAALARGEVARLTKIHGVGKKTAERLVLELREKVKLLEPGPGTSQPGRAASPQGPSGDLVSALVNLGYKPAQAEAAATAVVERLGEGAALEALLREALKALRTG
ncbi:MAG: Holliday junction branch migration protein RuvA [Myxococcaceae bacterium]|nr:Holliday junction branch migration protein RuvA [Myxococcaceae bacterium]